MAIAKEHLGNEEFTSKYWPPPHELYFDGPPSDPKNVPIFKECNGKKQGLMSGIGSYLVGGAVAKNLKNANDGGHKGNAAGEGFVLGSVLVVSGKGELLMHHKEMTWGDHPGDAELLDAMGKI